MAHCGEATGRAFETGFFHMVVLLLLWVGGNACLFKVLRCDNHACCQGQIGVCKRLLVLSARGLL